MTDQAIHLTPRQRQILALIAQGVTYQEIGRQLGITEKTVTHYVQAIRARLNAYTRAHAVALAIQKGLLSPNGLEEEF